MSIFALAKLILNMYLRNKDHYREITATAKGRAITIELSNSQPSPKLGVDFTFPQ